MENFSDWYSDRIIAEGKKKKAQPVQMKKTDDGPLTVDISDVGRAGFLPPSHRTGPHDSRPKRQKTRSAANQKAIRDQS